MSSEYICPVKEHITIEAIGKGALDSDLTYFIEAVPDNVDKSEYRTGLNAWSAVAKITFREVATKADADLVFSTGRGPRSQFDGKGKVLAWAELGPHGNRQLLMRLDLDEDWNRSILFMPVFVHETGHILGLDHSQFTSAIMYAIYNAAFKVPQQTDDIPRIRAIYGPPVATPPQPPVPNPGGSFVNRETVSAIVEFMFGYAEKWAAKSASRWDDFAVMIAKSQKDRIIDVLMDLFAKKGSLTVADVQEFMASDSEVQKLMAA